ncbi:MAG: translation initiation factor IF-2 [Candidatus Kerfeldbacteria bacterium RIFCSPHIGHO2_02_FULL_42_14]|uniref:Translation initiation factor IF-2 n=1 Tax=Candidatus Kerfeldbacteria bacterium RIFCSPHIGHO2_02_FULL_42_14 TaxID=1798540 RepID=A0A1G2ATR4_9BACT|nr:MAG: translation initiation factor IF-2 [Candidatus Kerfeldbacteria bacterium RIFCSPHIGHO2_02_FULL_42_14]OGY81576.1 MAG: translation initiation factor IF-2 [Candidatus Kerfeldbacteria bacterium RIFCSPHIGHO2_12_FULL_42_13]OGY83177.1 MAG: translation initiation factor IF-2 [Candidatus Kerfeldbacteria bacterium RIFCSPLOWO2_02_FULL_42_19]OGY86270.1 MAG: translation initiation factor IF-2 [Candidatus Kerfeldbacteria bacterium RIFCSPLOWO2_12_FULL_43_9]
MNVTELIRKLKMNKEEFFPLVQELGFDIGVRAIKVDDVVAQKIMQTIQQHRRTQGKSFFAEEKKARVEVASDAKVLRLPQKITVKNFAEKIGKPVTDLIAILMQNGIMATINENLDFETATIVAEDLGFKTEFEDVQTQKTEISRKALLESLLIKDSKAQLQMRAPVVVVMGHVDHGKTKLLDAIRKTNLVEQEAGGITQHIGAYQVMHQGRTITFIDTPGHEAFSAMRSRGARIADIAILVIAADDSIKPQTVEAIEIMEKAELPFIVAVNKIDKPEADIDRVKKDLAKYNLIPEDWGGKTICVPVSAKQRQGISELLDMILLVADIEKDHILANPQADAAGTIIESHIDKGKGPVATVLVQTGTLKKGELIVAGNAIGRIKAMYDWNSKALEQALPSQPAQFLGFKNTPKVGDILRVTHDRKMLKQTAKEYRKFARPIESSLDKKATQKQLSIILRADTLGSLEAIVESIKKQEHKEVHIGIIMKGLGNISEKDIVLAESTGSLILGFNVTFTPGAQQAAHTSQVQIHIFNIIYELLDLVKQSIEKLLEPETVFTLIGKAKILALFKQIPRGRVVGCKVTMGILKPETPVKMYREGVFLGEGFIRQLQIEQKKVPEVKSGSDCGVQFETQVDMQLGDEWEVYKKEQIQRTLKSE